MPVVLCRIGLAPRIDNRRVRVTLRTIVVAPVRALRSDLPCHRRHSPGGRAQPRRFSILRLVCLIGVFGSATPLWPAASPAPYLPPTQVTVLGVFLVPRDQAEPDAADRQLLLTHLRWTQARFRELLNDRDTFALAAPEIAVVPGRATLAEYRAAPEGGAPQFVSELLQHFGHTRFNCPHLFVVCLQNPIDNVPAGGGRPFNLGWNSGGGVVILSSWGLRNSANFQSTLQHELGHGFGLPHVDVYGYSMATSSSLMSYNPAHWTNGLVPSATPGGLLPEDIRVLLHNRLAFPRLRPDSRHDSIPGYTVAEPVWLGAMSIPGQADYRLNATTSHPGISPPTAMLLNVIKPNSGPGIQFDPGTMWHSGASPTGWVNVEVSFPLPVTLDRVGVHSQHSGIYWRAEQVRIETIAGSVVEEVIQARLATAEQEVIFPPATAQTWRFWFHHPAGNVVIRGLEFFSQGATVFGPKLPTFFLEPSTPTPPTIVRQPQPTTVVNGSAAVLTVQATGSGPLSVQWHKDNVPIPGATSPRLAWQQVASGDEGIYTAVVANRAGSARSDAVPLTVPSSDGRLVNLSLLTNLATPDDAVTLGAVISGPVGSAGKSLLVRAAGPALAAVGVPAGHPDPRIELFAGPVRVAENDNWIPSDAATAAFARTGAFAFTPGSRDAVLLAEMLPAGGISVRVSGATAATGTVLAELYDATPPAAASASGLRLVNFSVLKPVGSGFTAGFVLGGRTATPILVRAIGASLAEFGVTDGSVDPVLTLYAGARPLERNDNWGGGETLARAMSQVGAFPLPPASTDAAVLVSLAPGDYSVQVGGSPGLVLLEVYQVR